MTEGLATDGPRRIVDHRALDDRHRLLTLAADDALAGFRPGQFAMLSCGDGLLLRRPFSLQRSALCDGVRVVELLYRVVGRGTAALASLTPGTVVTALGPLGRPFDPPPAGARPVLLGGGVGIRGAESLEALGDSTFPFPGAGRQQRRRYGIVAAGE